MNCIKCNKEIPAERLEALPNTDTCVNCSSVKKYKGIMDFAHKTAGECVIFNPDNKEVARLADRYNRRAR